MTNNKPNYLRNSGTPIKSSEIQTVQKLAKQNTPTRVIALKIGRSPASVRNIATDHRISLKPTNQSPYNRRQK